METRRWMNHSLPQTLSNAVLLLYVSAAFDALFGAVFSVIGLVIVAGKVAAGYGIANEKKWGYQLGVAVAFLPFVLGFIIWGIDGLFAGSILALLFDVILIVLLLHDDSRQHQRIWFS